MNNTLSKETELVRLFCRPPTSPFGTGEMRVLGKSETFTVPYKTGGIHCYAWGEGAKVLLCHGWGSRAGHMIPAALHLVRSGFRAVTFDAPAHTSLPKVAIEETSSLFEFGRAVSAVANHLDGVFGVIGHSLGGMAVLFTLAGYPHLEDCRFPCEKLVLLNVPASLRCIIKNFTRHHRLTEAQAKLLEAALEEEFSMCIDLYDCVQAFVEINARVLVVQDDDDDQFLEDERLKENAASSDIEVLRTATLGHDLVLANRAVFFRIVSFLKKNAVS